MEDPTQRPFADPPDPAVISLRRIVFGEQPVRCVAHDEDGSWQFLDGDDVPEEDAAIVGLGETAAHDPTLIRTATLPRGWHALRDAGRPWRVAPRGMSVEE